MELQLPDLSISESDIGRTGTIRGENADGSSFVGAVTDARDILFVDIETDVAATGNGCNQVHGVEGGMNSAAVAID